MARTRVFRAVLVAATLALVALPGAAEAHETRSVGKYSFVVGWNVEPAYEGIKNGVDLRVQLPGTAPIPVEGVEKTLKVEVTNIAGGQQVTVPLETVFGSPGRYIAHLVPTVPGQYSFRFFGTIEGNQINETFTSGEKFNNIQTINEIQFPEKVAQVREVQGVASDAQQAADDADSTASSARTLAIVAIALAVLSGAGTAAALVTRRR
ncbi:MAG: hypothetical protein IT360_04480 [Gemmatimonadaceae bacterium]|nr:hypothetical protein [Gemmatimonadaceae bacterium]